MNQTTARKSWLPLSGGNLFQGIKKRTAEAEAAGIRISKLSIGQPSGPALLSARKATASAVLSDAESMHEYQDNGSPGVPGFAKEFSLCHMKGDQSALSADQIAYLPIPGIKPMLPLIPLSCGASENKRVWVATMTDPGYPTPAFWCKRLPGVVHQAIRLHSGNNFLFTGEDVVEILNEGGLLMLNYPHNPSGKAADREWLRKLCAAAQDCGVRIFNDAAYAILAHSEVHTSLADVAVEFPNLSWAEAYSSSKAGNFTGWRIGAIAGSPDFVGDIATIKGDADSGFAAPMAAGVLDAFKNDRASIEAVRKVYAERIELLVETLSSLGMHLAVTPDAGFFTLWNVPVKAFGVEVKDAEHFNALMIENTGLVGVHFHPYIRYSVTGHIHKMLPDIKAGFEKANVSY